MITILGMRAQIVIPVLASILILGTLGLTQEAYALNLDDMIGSTAHPSSEPPNPGSITLVSQTDGSQALIGTPTTSGSLSGLDFDFNGILWGTNNNDVPGISFPVSTLMEINPNTGDLISSVPVTDSTGAPVGIQDLGVQPGTNVLFGTTVLDGPFGAGALVTIDKSTGVATFVGTIQSGPDIFSIDFAPDGTLYEHGCNNTLRTINPNNAFVPGCTPKS